MKKILLAAAFAAVVFSGKAENKAYFFSAGGDESYEQMGDVASVSPNGEYAVIYDYEMEQSFLWRKSDPEKLEMLNRVMEDGSTQSMEVRYVSDNGTILGSIRPKGDSQWHPFYWPMGGEIVYLPMAEWASNLNYPCGMSADENIIGGQLGGSCMAYGKSHGQNRPAFWVKGSDGEYELLAYTQDEVTLPVHDGTYVMGMYSDGTLEGSYLYGTLGCGAGSHIPFIYRDKELTIWHTIDYVEVGWLYKGEIRGYETIETIDGWRDYYRENDAIYGAFYSADLFGNLYGTRAEIYDVNTTADPLTDPDNYGMGSHRDLNGYYNIPTKTWYAYADAPTINTGLDGKVLFSGMNVYPDGLESTPQSISSYFNLNFGGRNMLGVARASGNGTVLGASYMSVDPMGIDHSYTCMIVLDDELVGVDAVEADSAAAQNVKVVNGTIEVTGAENVAVYNMTGMKVAEGNSCAVADGIYVVVADGVSHKVLVK